MITGSLTTCDPGDISTTIATCKSLNIRCSVIALSAEVMNDKLMTDVGSFSVCTTLHLCPLYNQNPCFSTIGENLSWIISTNWRYLQCDTRRCTFKRLTSCATRTTTIYSGNRTYLDQNGISVPYRFCNSFNINIFSNIDSREIDFTR